MNVPQELKRLLQYAKRNGVDVKALMQEIDAGGSVVDPSEFKKLSLDKGIYDEAKKQGKDVAEILAEQDPDSNYGNCPLDAFERQLAVRQLSISGPNSIKLESFYDKDNSVLFPGWIDREIKAGMIHGAGLLNDDDVVAADEQIDSGRYDAAFADMTGDFSYAPIGEGAEFPTISIKTADKPVDLRKIGRELKMTYESGRRIKANVMGVFLRLVGQQLAKDKADHATDVLVNGNTGNSNGAASFAKTTLSYDNMVEFFAEIPPYNADVLIAPKTGWMALLKLAEFKDPVIASKWLTGGEPVTPLGWTLKRHDPSTAGLLSSKLLAVDSSAALVRVTERGSQISEAHKLMSSQWDKLNFSMVIGYAKMIGDTARVWDYS
jgi:hypothetical protein